MNPYLVSWLRFNDAGNIAKDECGNTWRKLGTPTITSDNAILGTALQLTDTSQTVDIIGSLTRGGQDFSMDEYITFDSDAPMYPLRFRTQGSGLHVFPEFLISTSTVGINLSGFRTFFPKNAISPRTRHHFALSYVHQTGVAYYWLDGRYLIQLPPDKTEALELPLTYIKLCTDGYGTPTYKYVIIDEFRLFDGIALWTEPFTPPTTEADYDLTECPFSVFMPATRSIVKPADEFSNVKRTVNKTAEEFSNISSQIVRSENIFSNVKRTVDKTAEESANVKREVNVSTVNDFSPIRRTVNVDDNFANVKRSVVESADNFSATKRGVVFSEEYDFQPQRRLTNLADEFAPVRRLVHEPQVVDVYTRRRLTNLDDNFADTQRKILATSDNAVDLKRAVIFSTNNFSPTKRTVNKTAAESANVKRQILFSAENDLPSVRRVINADDNFANVQSSVIKSADNFSPTKRETLRSEICYVETSRRAELLSVIVALKSQQGNVLGYIRFQKDKTSSIGHLVTCFNGINFYAGLVDVDSPTAGNFRVFKYGNLYAVEETI